jgi:ABC-type multidrug transport system ATPase subunit
VGKEEAKIVGEERLKRVRLWHRRDGRVGTFSGGMRRRLSMVLSTIGDPKLVILDEVTTGLDPVSILP